MQELADRLITSVEELDVLYVCLWLAEMRERGCLEEGVDQQRESPLSLAYSAATEPQLGE
jgi:hypothetical protein